MWDYRHTPLVRTIMPVQQSNYYLLLDAIYKQEHKKVKKLIKACDINTLCSYCFNKTTPLILAAKSGDSKIVKLLLKNKARVNQQNEWGNTALHCASDGGHVTVVQTLLAYNADINIANKHGNTALHHAALNNRQPVVQVLLENGADATATNHASLTPFDLSQKKHHVDTDTAFERQQPNDNSTTLHMNVFVSPNWPFTQSPQLPPKRVPMQMS